MGRMENMTIQFFHKKMPVSMLKQILYHLKYPEAIEIKIILME